jgi:hypothetical protein
VVEEEEEEEGEDRTILDAHYTCPVHSALLFPAPPYAVPSSDGKNGRV